tara:strand:+ start:21944 stop:22132 length:189 start_codon:yes stop_codon:yes gene_type:complete
LIIFKDILSRRIISLEYEKNKKNIPENTKSIIYGITNNLGEDIKSQEDWNYLLKLYKILKNN